LCRPGPTSGATSSSKCPWRSPRARRGKKTRSAKRRTGRLRRPVRMAPSGGGGKATIVVGTVAWVMGLAAVMLVVAVATAMAMTVMATL
jgi:hypothetical protein